MYELARSFRLFSCHFVQMSSIPFRVIIIVIKFMFLGINMFWDLHTAHFHSRLMARAKMTLSRAELKRGSYFSSF